MLLQKTFRYKPKEEDKFKAKKIIAKRDSNNRLEYLIK
jgi:hypothetical protein